MVFDPIFPSWPRFSPGKVGHRSGAERGLIGAMGSASISRSRRGSEMEEGNEVIDTVEPTPHDSSHPHRYPYARVHLYLNYLQPICRWCRGLQVGVGAEFCLSNLCSRGEDSGAQTLSRWGGAVSD